MNVSVSDADRFCVQHVGERDGLVGPALDNADLIGAGHRRDGRQRC
jgi:hypothetical protein